MSRPWLDHHLNAADLRIAEGEAAEAAESEPRKASREGPREDSPPRGPRSRANSERVASAEAVNELRNEVRGMIYDVNTRLSLLLDMTTRLRNEIKARAMPAHGEDASSRPTAHAKNMRATSDVSK